MGKFYLTSAVLFLIGLAILWQSAEKSMVRPASGSTANPLPPILMYTGGLIMLAGTLAFVTTFSTHSRLAANLPPKDLVEL